MSSHINALGHAYERMMCRRTILLASHIILGLLSGFCLMSQEDFGHYPYWGRVGISALSRHLVASWPYLLSGVICYRRGSISLLGLVALEVILVVGTALGVLVYLGKLGSYLEGPGIIAVSIAQAWIFSKAATILMRQPL